MKSFKALSAGFLALICIMGNTSLAKAATVNVSKTSCQGQAVVTTDGTGNYTSIQGAIGAGETNILIKNGTYKISSPLIVRKKGTIITGESTKGVKIIQTNQTADGVVLYADDSGISHVTVDCQTYGGLGSAIVEGHSSNVKVSDCIVYGSNNGFSIYFAGKDYKSDADTIAGVETGNLDQNNVIEQCTVYSSSKTDGVILALQGNGKMINNTIIGTRIAFYMCNSSLVSGNTVIDSSQEGIFVSIPAFNNVIKNNRISHCALSGIKVAAETEHMNDAIRNHTYVGKGFTIENNTIENPAYFGMDVDELADSVIRNNKLSKCDYMGMYLLRSNNLSLFENKIENAGYGVNEPENSNYKKNLENGISWNVNDNSGIFLDYKACDNKIVKNTINSFSPGCVHAIFACSARGDATVTRNVYSGNKTPGNFSGAPTQY
ncbi:MAG TPA: right-handed parallel beta-helix repeat-containing protein [Caproiciproducens sp.]|nr:right-handed parallel beta-helix repeat-containing protein [Caproiciproducens sp.]